MVQSKITLTQLTTEELKELIGEEVRAALENAHLTKPVQTPRIGGIELAVEITGYTQSSIYTMVSRGKIPSFKRDGRLLFNEEKLRQWLTEKDNQMSVDYDANFKANLKPSRNKRNG